MLFTLSRSLFSRQRYIIDTGTVEREHRSRPTLACAFHFTLPHPLFVLYL